MSELLQVKGARKSFGGLQAIGDVDLSVEAGEVVGIIGPNGAGKTTLLNCISGSLRLDGGTVTFAGKRIERLGPNRIAALGLARTLQLAEHFKDFTVLDFVMLGRQRYLPTSIWLCGLSVPRVVRAERREIRAVYSLLEEFGLADHAQTQLHELPYGSQRLVDVVRAVAADPQLTLLDEPTSGSSLYERSEMRQHIDRFRRNGMTALIVDHDVGFVSDCCDRVIAMAVGRTLCAGTPGQVLAHPEVVQSYLGTDSPAE